MQQNHSPFAVIAVTAAALAGYADAIAFMSAGGFFVTSVSGNVTRTGVGLGAGSIWVALTAFALILSFLSGAMLARVLGRATEPRRDGAVMAAVSVLLFFAASIATLTPGPLVLLLLATAMGMQAGSGITMAWPSEILVRLGHALGGALMGEGDRWGWVPWLALLLGFLAGAVSGAAAHMQWGWQGLWLGASVATALTLVLVRVERVGS